MADTKRGSRDGKIQNKYLRKKTDIKPPPVVQQKVRGKRSYCKLAGKLLAENGAVTFGKCFGNLFSIDNPACAEKCDLLCLKIDEVYSRPGFSHLENLSLEKGVKDICPCPDPELCIECGVCNLLQAREVASIIHAHP